MKKILLLLLAMTAILPASADRYFSLRYDTISAVNGTLSIYPDDTGDCMYQMYMTAHLDGYIDNWYLKMNHPSDVTIDVDNSIGHQVVLGPAMSVPYVNNQGNSVIYNATLLTNSVNQEDGNGQLSSHFASRINIMGYWHPNAQSPLESYGTVKWPEGDHDYLFSFWLYIPPHIHDCDLTFDLTLKSSYDYRDVLCLNSHSVRNLHIHVGYRAGDVDGDGQLNISDVTGLIDLLLSGEPIQSEDVQHAADVDGDGTVNVADVADLIDLILNN